MKRSKINFSGKVSQPLRKRIPQGVKVLQTEDQDFTGTVFIKKIGKATELVKQVTSNHASKKRAIFKKEIETQKIMHKFSSISGSQINFPKVYSFKSRRNFARAYMQFIKGVRMDKLAKKDKIKAFIKIQRGLCELSKKLPEKELNKVPERQNLILVLAFPVYLLITLMKEKKLKQYIQCAIVFYRNFFNLLFDKELALSHRDLNDRNVIQSSDKIFLIDLEVMARASKFTDLACFVRYQQYGLTSKDVMRLLSEISYRKSAIGILKALAIFYAIQMIAISNKKDTSYTEAVRFLDNSYFNIFNLEKNHKSLGQILHLLLALISKLVNNFYSAQFGKSSFIICFHAVDNRSNWEFSTSTKDFIKQIDYLKRNYSIVKLSEIVRNPSKNKVAITFDDGYQNLLRTAVPYLVKNKIPATFFVMSDNKNANRKELDNNKKLLTNSQIKKISSLGFDIGFHSATHTNLRSADKLKLYSEIVEGKAELEAILKRKVKFFAYPRGLYSENVIHMLKKAGFTKAFTIESGKINTNKEYLIPRYSIGGNISLEDFKNSTTSAGLFLDNCYMRSLFYKDRFLEFMKNNLSRKYFYDVQK